MKYAGTIFNRITNRQFRLCTESNKMICKGCGLEKKLIKAHVIPESFFRGLKEGEKAPKIHSNTKGIHPKKTPIGVYDKTILCHDCEQIFQDLDAYGYHLLIGRESEQKQLVQKGELLGHVIQEVDHTKLKLFFISLLWRASISTHYFYEKISLGPHEARTKALIWQNDPGGEHDYSFVLARFEGDGIGRSILNPHPERLFGKNYCRIYLYGYVLYIKVDSQPTPELWANFLPKDDRLLIVSRGFIENTKEYGILLEGTDYYKNST